MQKLPEWVSQDLRFAIHSLNKDLAGQRKVAVVNEAFARKFFSKNDPLGEKVNFPEYDQAQQQVKETPAAPPARSGSHKKSNIVLESSQERHNFMWLLT